MHKGNLAEDACGDPYILDFSHAAPYSNRRAQISSETLLERLSFEDLQKISTPEWVNGGFFA
jgi:hypothetical protein